MTRKLRTIDGATLLIAATVALACRAERVDRSLPLVQANDNRIAGGRQRGDTLDIALVVSMATWRPEADSGPSIDVAAFSEAGQAPRIPAPLIRVRRGTTIVATIKNTLRDSTIRVVGFSASDGDSIVIAPGDSATTRFTPRDAGTFFYAAVLGKHIHDKDEEREQVAGALVVDPPEGSPPDRVLVMNIWGRQIDSTNYQNALAINGRSWPYDERIEATVGDTLRWRVVNTTDRGHPMHLHGFYFDVLSHGAIGYDSVYATSERPKVVTQVMAPFTTMTTRWVAEREGQWLFHCHIGFHVVPDTRLQPPPASAHAGMAHDPATHMAGLVLGILVKPQPGVAQAARPVVPPRTMRLLVQETRKRGRAPRAVGFVLQRGNAPPAADSVEIPGTPLALTRGVPTNITVVNHLREPTAVHWHGIELESYSDGVAGWSGGGAQLAPSIAPGDSFVAKLTLPRAGTFIYHTHLNDLEQLTSGMYGAIVVLEPGQTFDPSHDHLYVIGWDGPQDPPHVLVNGDSASKPLTLAANVTHRFRFVNIGVAVAYRIGIYRGDSLVAWIPVGKDGAAISGAKSGPALRTLDVGETFDAEARLAPGEYHLRFNRPKKVEWEQSLIVR